MSTGPKEGRRDKRGEIYCESNSGELKKLKQKRWLGSQWAELNFETRVVQKESVVFS